MSSTLGQNREHCPGGGPSFTGMGTTSHARHQGLGGTPCPPSATTQGVRAGYKSGSYSQAYAPPESRAGAALAHLKAADTVTAVERLHVMPRGALRVSPSSERELLPLPPPLFDSTPPLSAQAAFCVVYKASTRSDNKRWLQRRLTAGESRRRP